MVKVKRDLTGEVLGRFTVIQQAEDHVERRGKRVARWTCRCACGNVTSVLGGSLTRRGYFTRSCGCLKDEANERKVKDLSGKTFGWLRVLEQNGFTPQRKAIWTCRCRCGEVKDVPSSVLTSGVRMSCGCAAPNELATPLKVRFGQYVRRAKVMGLPFALSKQGFAEITSRKCAYCGDMPGSHNGVDRIENSEGYLPENCAPACSPCNNAKRTMTAEEFMAWVTKVYEFNMKG